MSSLRQWWMQFSGAHSLDHSTQLFYVHFNVLLCAFSFWSTQPLLPFFSKLLAVDAVTYGYFQTTFHALQLMGSPVIGRLCDSIGPHRALTIGHLSAALSNALLGFASSIPLLFASQLPTVLMHPVQSSQAITTNLTDGAHRSWAIGRLGLSYGVGMVLGSSFGGWLSVRLGYNGVAFFSSSVNLFLVLLNLAVLHDPRPLDPKPPKRTPEASSTSLHFSQNFHLLQQQPVRELLLLQFTIGLGLSVQRSSFSQTLQNMFLLSAQEIGYVISFAAVIGVLVNSFGIRWLHGLFSERVILVSSLLLSTATYVLYSFTTNLRFLLVLLVPMGISSTLIYSLLSTRMTLVVDRQWTGTSIGLSHTTRTLCGVIAPTVGGYLMGNFGFWVIGWFGALMNIFSLAYVLFKFSLPNPIHTLGKYK